METSTGNAYLFDLKTDAQNSVLICKIIHWDFIALTSDTGSYFAFVTGSVVLWHSCKWIWWAWWVSVTSGGCMLMFTHGLY